MGLITNLKAVLLPADQEPDSPPAWIGRLKESKYVSISGVEIPFLYLDLSSFFTLKTSVFESVTGDGGYVQINGLGANRFPVAMIFTGSNNDNEARACISALTETGEGTLYHPTHGRLDVAPTGQIEQTNAYVTAANETIVAVEFIETTGLQFDDLPPFDSVLDSYLDGAGATFESVVDIDDPADAVSFADDVVRTVAEVKNTLDKLSDGVAETQAQMDDIFDSIDSSIDTLIKDPLMLARQVQKLISTPAKRAGLTRSKLSAYGNMARNIFFRTPKPNGYDFTAQNSYASDVLVAGACVSSASESVYGEVFKTRSEYIAAATDLDALAEEFRTWADNSAEILGIDSGNDWQDLIDTITQTVSRLITDSFTSLTEYTITTEFERATIDWCFELYGSAKYEPRWFFTETNNLGGDEILTIQAGRTLVYYG